MYKTRIIFINLSSNISGVEKVLLNLIDYLVKKSIEPIVVCQNEGQFTKELRNKGISIKIISIPMIVRTYNPIKLIEYLIRYIYFTKALLHILKRLDIDIIHCNFVVTALYSLITAKLTKTPIILHMHQILKNRLLNKIIIRIVATYVDKIICVSYAVKNNLVQFGVSNNKCVVIYNSIYNEASGKKIKPYGFRKEIGADDNSKIITMVGQIAEWKGQEVFIEAVSKLTGKYNKLKCIIVGDIVHPLEQGYKERIYKKTSSLNLSGVIMFTGFRDDIGDIMNDSDVIVHASIKPDPLPTVIIEAMSAGKPVVATNVGGVPELVVDKESGFIVPPKDADAMAEAISKLLDSHILREKMGIEGKRVMENEFNFQENLTKLLNLYHTLLPDASRMHNF